MKSSTAMKLAVGLALVASLSTLGVESEAMAEPAVTTPGGTVNYVPKFKGTTSVGNSQIYDNGTNVGIGTSAPAAKLEIRSTGAGILLNSSTTGDPFVKLIGDNSNEGANLWYQNQTGDIYLDQIWPSDSARTHFRMKTAGTTVEPLTLTAPGRVGIGTTTPAFKLDVSSAELFVARLYGTHTQATILQFGNKNSATAWNLAAGGNSGWPNNNFSIDENSVAQRLVIRPGGNVGIGTTAPAYKLDLNGTVNSARMMNPSASRQSSLVKPLDNASGRIDCLEGVSYRAKSAGADEDFQLDLVGDEVEACFPELVSTAPDGVKSIDYARLVVPLIEATKEQQQDLRELEAELAKTNARLARLEAALQAKH